MNTKLHTLDEPLGSNLYLTEKGLQLLDEVEDIADLPSNVDISYASKQLNYWLVLQGIVDHPKDLRMRRVLFNTRKKGDANYLEVLLKLREGGFIDAL